jgi:hypothetical protein
MTRTIIVLLTTFSLTFLGSCKKDDLSDESSSSQNSETNNLVVETIQRNSGSEKAISLGDKTFIIGYTQLNNNQDAYALCKRGEETIWSRYYDRSTDDSRGEAMAYSGNNLIVAFSCTGGNTDFEATSGAFQMSYGSGGGPKIIFLARLNASSGIIEKATFIGCKLNNGNTNTIRVQDDNPQPITFTNEGNIRIMATKAYDRADGRLTPGNGDDQDCLVSGGSWEGIFSLDMRLISGNCFPD